MWRSAADDYGRVNDQTPTGTRGGSAVSSSSGLPDLLLHLSKLGRRWLPGLVLTLPIGRNQRGSLTETRRLARAPQWGD